MENAIWSSAEGYCQTAVWIIFCKLSFGGWLVKNINLAAYPFDHSIYRGQKCKHIYAVEFSTALREEVKKVAVEHVIKPLSTLNCKYCDSENIIRHGIRRNKKSGDIQVYHCKACKHFFTINAGFEGMHGTPQLITASMQLYFSGESLRNVQKFLRMQGLKVSHQTVWNWIKRYVSLMDGYLDKMQPQVSGT